MLVPDDPLWGVDQVGRRRPADRQQKSTSSPTRKSSRSPPSRLVGGATDEQIAGGHVEGVGPFRPQDQVPPHVEGRGHLLVAIESRFGEVAQGAPADSAYPIPGEIGGEVPQPGRLGHAVAVHEGQDLARRHPAALLRRRRGRDCDR